MLYYMCPYAVPMMEYDSETEEWVEVSGVSRVSDVPKVCDCLKVPLYILMDTTPNYRVPKKRQVGNVKNANKAAGKQNGARNKN